MGGLIYGSSRFGKNLENVLKERVHAAIDQIGTTLDDNKLRHYESYLLRYPQFLSNKVKKGDVGPATKKGRAEKLSELERIIRGLSVPVEKPDEDDPSPEKGAYSRYILQDSSLREYKINIFNPRTDTKKKIQEMAKKVKMCWTKEESEFLSAGMADDCKLNGATIVYSIEIGNKTAAVVRDFICVDKKGRYYLFMDTIEGKDSEVSHHDIDRWALEYPGAMKLGIITSLYLADMIGLEYVAAGDDAIADVFETLGATKIKTAVGRDKSKIGYAPKTDPTSDDVDTVREYFFFSNNKNYSVIINPKLKNKESKIEWFDS